MAETIASMAVKIGVDLSGFQKDMAEFKKSFGRVGSQVQAAGQQIGTAFTAAGGAIAVGLGMAVSKAADFDSEMSRVGAIAGATGADFDAMRKTALDLGASTSKSASEVAQGMELMAAKGYDANQVMAAMPGVISAAEASGEDMALVADTVASALNAFQMEATDASRVADVLAKSANTSAAGVDDLQYAFKYAAPVFQNAGYSIEQLAAATGIMADAGMKGEQAGTTLRAAMLRLADPPKKAANMMHDLGISVTDASGKFLPLDNIIGQLSTSTENLTNAEKSQAISAIFGTEAMTGMLSLVEAGPAKFNALTEGLNNAGGASATAAAQMKNNLTGSMQELGGAVETLQISIGSALAPAIRTVADTVAGLVNAFNSMSPATQQFIAYGAALTAGLLILAGGIGFLVAGLGFLAAAEWAVILPVAGIIAGITAVIAIFAALAFVIYNNWDGIQAYFANVWKSIIDLGKSVWGTLSTFFSALWSQISEAVTSAWNHISGFFATLWKNITSGVTAAWNAIANIFTTAWNAISPIVQAGIDIISAIFNAFVATGTAIFTAIWETIKTIFATALLFVYYLVTGKWDEIGALFDAAGKKFLSIITTMWNSISSTWTTTFQTVQDSTSKAWDTIQNLFSSAWQNIKATVASMWNNIKQSWQDSRTNIEKTTSTLWQNVLQFFHDAPGKVTAALTQLGTAMLDKWNGIKADALEMGKNIIQGMIDGVMSMAQSIASAAADVVKSAIDAAKNALGIHSPSKVFMEIGGYTGEGFALGLEDTMPNVQGAMEHLVSIPDANPLGSAGTAKTANVGSGGVTVLVDLDGHTIARAVGQPLVDLIRVKTGLRI